MHNFAVLHLFLLQSNVQALTDLGTLLLREGTKHCIHILYQGAVNASSC